jgi:glycosyltransferase involved in cell wall biosynthesis
VLFVTDNLNVGGAQRSLTNLLSAMPQRIARTLCVVREAYGGDQMLDSLRHADVSICSLRECPQPIDVAEHIIDIVMNGGFRAVCFWNVNAATKLLVAKSLPGDSVRLVDVSPGPMLLRELQAAAGFQRRISFTEAQYFERLTYVVEKHAHGPLHAHASVPAGRLVVIPNGVPLPPGGGSVATVARRGAAPPRMHVVGTLCRIVPSKRLECLVDAMKHLSSRMPAARLVVVGAVERSHIDYWDAITQRVRNHGLAHVTFAGGRSDVWNCLQQFDVFALTGRDQGCPNASLEAMASGLPIVASSDGGTCEQVRDGVNGFFVTEDNTVVMAEKLEFLLRNPEAASIMGEAGRSIARREFSMAAMVERYVTLLMH